MSLLVMQNHAAVVTASPLYTPPPTVSEEGMWQLEDDDPARYITSHTGTDIQWILDTVSSMKGLRRINSDGWRATALIDLSEGLGEENRGTSSYTGYLIFAGVISDEVRTKVVARYDGNVVVEL